MAETNVLKKQGDICPECGGQLWRDEHPDGVANGIWCCSDCDWSEFPILNIDEEDFETEF